MCRYSISIDDAVMEQVRPHFSGEQAVQQWLEQQLRTIVLEFVRESNKRQSRPHWYDYKLSPEIEALAPHDRKSVYGNYKEELSTILEEEYR